MYHGVHSFVFDVYIKVKYAETTKETKTKKVLVQLYRDRMHVCGKRAPLENIIPGNQVLNIFLIKNFRSTL
jgi:hypothetical protein